MIISGEKYARLEEVLARLSARERLLLNLYCEVGLPHCDIAELARTPIRKVAASLDRARKPIRGVRREYGSSLTGG
jgi:DNA-directed RNA polymerase specialized sigma24 family protein